MAVMAPVSGFSLAALTRLTAELPLPEAAAAADKQSRVPDVVVFSSAPMRLLSDLASAGLRQLAVLLPVLEQAVEEKSAAPLGYLAKAAGAAARQIGEGQAALLAEGPDRVAAALQGQVPLSKAAVASGATDTNQLLRTLARQIGAATEPQQEVGTTETLRTVVRQVGEGGVASLAESPDRAAAVLQGQPAISKAAPASAAIDTKESLRTLARQIGAEAAPQQEGGATETLRTIVRQIGASDRLEPRIPAEPGADPIQHWVSEAKHVLRSTGEALDQAEQQLRPLATTAPSEVAGAPPTAWALTEIIAAQAQIALAYASLGQARTSARRTNYRPASLSLPLAHLANATTMLGVLLVIATLWLIGGLWGIATGFVALVTTASWVWRINRASRGVRLDARS